MTTPANTSRKTWNQLLLVGVGLLGGSIAAAVRQAGLAKNIVGVGRNPERLQAAQQAGLIDSYSTDLPSTAAESDFVIVCTPVGRVVADILTAATACKPETRLTDVGSVKATICSELQIQLPEGHSFIGSHPLAGSEKQGFEHACPNLFNNRTCIVTPDENSSSGALKDIKQFWKSLGMHVLEMSAKCHDIAIAETSHTPHVVSAALAAMLASENQPLTSTGFRDTTRIAAGSPDLWVDILLSNGKAISESLRTYTDRLNEFQNAIADGDATTLKKLLQEAKTNRDSLNT